jgi:hypothetical protein
MTTLTNDNLNGIIYLVPFTKLQAPDSSTPAYINIYAKCNNLQVNGLRSDNFPNLRTVFESAYIEFESSSLPVTEFVINPTNSDGDTSCIQFFGEQPLSFRTCLKRYSTGAAPSLAAKVSTTLEYLRVVENIYPLDALGFTGTVGTINNLFDYLRYAYLGMRGGFRRRINIPGFNYRVGQQVRVKLTTPGTSVTTSCNYSGTSGAVMSNVAGAVTFIPSDNGGIEFETPCYTNNLFLTPCNGNTITPTGAVTILFRGWELISDTAQTQPATFVHTELACAEDFNFMRFQGAPYFTI